MEEQIQQPEIKRNKNGQFVKGQSGFKLGLKGRISVVALIRHKLEEVEPKSRKTYGKLLVDVIIKKALKTEDVPMIRDIIDRIDGKPLQVNVNKNVDVTEELDKIEQSDYEEVAEKI